MRIAFVSTMEAAPWGASENLWSETALRLRNAGQDIHVNVCQWPSTPEPIQALQQSGCQFYFRRPPHVFPRLERKKRLEVALSGEIPHPTGVLSEANDWQAVNSWLDRVRPEFVVISEGYYLEGYNLREACAHRGIRFAPIVHSAHDYAWPSDALVPAIAGNYEAAAVCFFISRRMLDFVRRVLATPLLNATVVRAPYNAQIGEEPLAFPAMTEPFRLACVGRLDCAQKGQDLLFEVLRAEKWKQRKLTVSLYGSGSNKDTLIKLQKMYELNNVEFCGYVSDVGSIWREHHALILPSRYEGLPAAVVEAMLCGRPCIVTDVMGNAELITDGETGFVAEAATPRHIDEALEKAWQARAQWPEIGRRAAASVRTAVPKDPTGVFAEEVLRWAGTTI